MKHILITLLFFFFCFTQKSVSQKTMDIGFEFQAYPTGLIPGISIEKQLASRSFIYARIGYNWIRHRDLGKHDDERGDGYGFSLGYKRYFNDQLVGWQLGVKNDIWWNSIDWQEGSSEGNTQITVLQPTLSLGYTLNKSQWLIIPSLAFGYEVNVRTEGEPTGEGAILLVGIQVAYRTK